MTPRERFLAAAAREPVDRPPLWLMRQAGRYLPEYRELKAAHDFLTLVRTPELAAEVTLQPMRRFPFDAAVIFSDILVIPEALGQTYHFRDEGGIGMDFVLDTPEKIDALDPRGVRDKLAYVGRALERTRATMGHDHALLGFAGAPWTLACYMLEGGTARDYTAVKQLAWQDPERFGALMRMLADAVADYLHLQLDAGADAVQLFDSWGAACPADRHDAWSLRWIRHIVDRLDGRAPVILYAKGMGHRVEPCLGTGVHVLSVDWTVELREVRHRSCGAAAVQGNLDPATLTTDPETTRTEARRVLDDAGDAPGHIFNLGHGMLPSARIDCVTALAETVTGGTDPALPPAANGHA